jgi:hypothetical protein
VTMNRATIPGTVTGDTLTVNALGAATFTTAATNQSTIRFGASAGTVFIRTATQMKSLSLVNFTGPATITNVLLGTARIDSLKTPTPVTIAAASFPFNITVTGGNLLDTITVATKSSSARFTTTGTAAQLSNIVLNGQNAVILRFTQDTMKVVASVGSTGKLTVTNVAAGSVTFAALASPNTVSISQTVTGEANEPGNYLGANATAITMAALGDTARVVGAMNGGADTSDTYTFIMPATGTVTVTLSFLGTGAGTSDLLPDFDVVVCTSLQVTGVNAGQCRYNQDLIPGNGASLATQPETGTTTSIAGGTRVYIRTYAYFVSASGFASYKLLVKTQ